MTRVAFVHPESHIQNEGFIGGYELNTGSKNALEVSRSLYKALPSALLGISNTDAIDITERTLEQAGICLSGSLKRVGQVRQYDKQTRIASDDAEQRILFEGVEGSRPWVEIPLLPRGNTAVPLDQHGCYQTGKGANGKEVTGFEDMQKCRVNEDWPRQERANPPTKEQITHAFVGFNHEDELAKYLEREGYIVKRI